MNQSSRRRSSRFRVHIPVAVKIGKARAEHHVQTRDVSSKGLYFKSISEFGLPIQVGTPLEFSLALPGPLAKNDSVGGLHCMGRVVRIDLGAPGTSVGIAATIERHTFIRLTEPGSC